MTLFQTVRPLKSDRVKKILADPELRGKFMAAVKELRDGRDAIFIAASDDPLREKYLSVLSGFEPSTNVGEAVRLVHVKEISVSKDGKLLNED